MCPRIISASPAGDYRLRLSFADGNVGTVDLRDQIVNRGGVFTALEKQDFFNRVAVDSESGTIVWPNEVDLDPDVLYSQTKFDPSDKNIELSARDSSV